MGLLRRYLQSEIAEFHKNGIRLRVIGERQRLPKDIVRLIDDAEKRTADNQALDFVVALSYGGRQEIAAAARQLAAAVVAGEIAPDDIDEECFTAGLLTAGIPDPDLVIRTSGEQRLSNRSEEHTSELQSLMRISYAVFCLNKKKINITNTELDSTQ